MTSDILSIAILAAFAFFSSWLVRVDKDAQAFAMIAIFILVVGVVCFAIQWAIFHLVER